MKKIMLFTIVFVVVLASSLQAASTPALLTIPLGRNGGVCHAAFSPDSKTIVTATKDNTACIWDAETGQKLKTFKHNGWVRFAVFSANGKNVITAGDEAVVRIWDVVSENLLKEIQGRLLGISPNGKKFIVNTSTDEKIITPSIWDADLGKERHKLELPPAAERHFVFSDNGTKLATISEHHTFRIWDTESGKMLHEWDNSTIVHRIVWSPDETKLIVSDGFTAHIWEIESGKELQKMEGHNDFIFSVAFSPDGKKCASTSMDETARIWDAATGKELHKLQGDPNDRYINPSGGTFIRKDGREGQAMVQFLSAIFSPDSKKLLTHGGHTHDEVVRIWDVESGKELYVLQTGTPSLVVDAAFSPNGKKIVTFAGGLSIRVWDLERIQAQADQPPVLDF